MIEFVLKYCAGKTGDSEGLFFHFFIVVLEFDFFVTSYIASLGLGKRETSFLYFIKGFDWCLEDFGIDHENGWEIFIFPVWEEAHDHESFRDSNLRSCKTDSGMVRILYILDHFSTEFYILLPFACLYGITNRSEYRIIFSDFYFEHIFL